MGHVLQGAAQVPGSPIKSLRRGWERHHSRMSGTRRDGLVVGRPGPCRGRPPEQPRYSVVVPTGPPRDGGAGRAPGRTASEAWTWGGAAGLEPGTARPPQRTPPVRDPREGGRGLTRPDSAHATRRRGASPQTGCVSGDGVRRLSRTRPDSAHATRRRGASPQTGCVGMRGAWAGAPVVADRPLRDPATSVLTAPGLLPGGGGGDGDQRLGTVRACWGFPTARVRASSTSTAC
jgi:hypothetical protein